MCLPMFDMDIKSLALGGGHHYAHSADKEMEAGEPGAAMIVNAEGSLQLRPPHCCPLFP